MANMMCSLKYFRAARYFLHGLYFCSICILIYIRLNYGQISNERRILKRGAYYREEFIRGWRLS